MLTWIKAIFLAIVWPVIPLAQDEERMRDEGLEDWKILVGLFLPVVGVLLVWWFGMAALAKFLWTGEGPL